MRSALALTTVVAFALVAGIRPTRAETAAGEERWYAEARRLLEEYEAQVREADARPLTQEAAEAAGRRCSLYKDRISEALDKAAKAGNYECYKDPRCETSANARYERTVAEMTEEMNALCPRGGPFVIVSITPDGQGMLEIGLRNPRTGEVHGVSVAVDAGRLFRIGDRVRERHRGEAVILIPTGRAKEEDPPRQPVYRPVGDVSREPAPKVPPCIANATACPPTASGEPTGRPLDLKRLRDSKSPAAARAIVPVASMSFRFDEKSLTMPASSGPDCQVLASGSFTSDYRSPAGPLKIGDWIVRGNSDKRAIRFTGTKTTGATTLHRGALVLDGRSAIPRIIRQNGDLSKYYGVMGGGALLLEGGRKVSEDDLCCCQAFVNDGPRERDENGRSVRTLDPSTCGFGSGQFARAVHVIVASRGSEVWVLALEGSGKALRDALYDAGFDDAVKLDGGRGAFMIRGDEPVFDGRVARGKGAKGQNSQRLCITEVQEKPAKRNR